MPNIDSAENEDEADRKVIYWAAQIAAMGATHIAGVRKRKIGKDSWVIDIEIDVDPGSEEYQEFLRNWRGL